MLNLFKSIFDGIPSTIENDRIQTTINDQKKRFKEGFINGFEIEDSALKNSDQYKLLEKAFSKIEGYKGKPVDFLFHIAEMRVKNNDKLLEVAEALFGNRVMKEAITYERVNVITYISICDWFIDFAISSVSVMASQIAYADHTNPYKNPIDKEQFALVSNASNLITFSRICSAVSRKFEETMADIVKLEGITFDPDDIEKQQRQFGASAVDPLSVGLVPVFINPAYWLGSAYNVWIKHRQKQSKEDISMLQMKIHRLERMRAGASPEDLAKIDDQIEYHADRLSRLREILEDIEEDA